MPMQNMPQVAGMQIYNPQAAVDGTYRGFGADWFNAENVAQEDWLRSEISAQQSWLRGVAQNRENNAFNASEALKNRDFQSVEAQKDRDFQSVEAQKAFDRQRLLRSTAYQDTLTDMKKAGLNPLLAFSQGASSAPSVSSPSGSRAGGSVASAGSGSGGSSSSNYYGGIPSRGAVGNVVATIAQIASMAMSGSLRAAEIASREKMSFDRITSGEKIAAMRNEYTDIIEDGKGNIRYVRDRYRH